MRILLVLGALVGAAVALALFGVAGAVQDPRVAAYRVALAGIDRPLRIVQLSDSHASAIDMPAARLNRVVAMMNAQHPDLIVLTGDYISGYPDAWTRAETRAALAPFSRLAAPLGVYAIVGNHDSPAETRLALAGTGVKLLVGATASAGPFHLIGADSLIAGSPAVKTVLRLQQQAPAGRPILLLSHEPDFFSWLGRRPVLQIAGHTHGGQIVLPFLPGYSNNDFRRQHMRGLFRERGHILIVSSGLGTSGIPMRVNMPPEIVTIDLVPR